MSLYNILDRNEMEHRWEQGKLCKSLTHQFLDTKFPEVNASTWKEVAAAVGPCLIKAKGEVLATGTFRLVALIDFNVPNAGDTMQLPCLAHIIT